MRRAFLGVWVVVLAACAERPPGDSCTGDGCFDADIVDRADDVADAKAPDADAALDVASEPPAPDVGLDAPADVASEPPAPDVGPDAPADVRDAGPDAFDAPPDAAPDVAPDVAPDAPLDARDAGPDVFDAPADIRDVAVDVREAGVDAPVTGGCISGAVGTHVARFRWTGTTSGSRASVSYEANTLPDRARWRVTANSRSIGYMPVWGDPFLGEGGLDLSGTVFIDVELSTAGLGAISNVTLAVYGRSYNTTASGSFAWRTFSGMGAAPSGLVANSAPYRWYRADATAAFVPGDNGVLLRITPGPPSGSLVVNRVEVCFDAR